MSYRCFFQQPWFRQVFNLKDAGSFWMINLYHKMVVKHSIKQNGGLPGQDMSRFYLRVQQFFGPQNAEVMRPKTWPLVLSQWPKTLRFWRNKPQKRRMKIKVKVLCDFLILCESMVKPFFPTLSNTSLLFPSFL